MSQYEKQDDKHPRKLVLIDGNSLFHRAFYALPPLANSDGQPTNAVYGFLTMFFRLLDDEAPSYVAVAFDKSAATFRHDMYEDYKAHRERMPDDLASQFPLLKEALEALNVKQYELEGFEADDLIGTLSRRASEEGLDVVIVTGDRDALQLVKDDVVVLLTRRGITDLDRWDPQRIDDDYGLEPAQLIDVKGLMGDNSDNIPGVYGIGEKTAVKFIKQFGSLDEVLSHLDEISGKKTRERLEEQADTARLSRKLATIKCDVDIEFVPDECEHDKPDTEHAIQLFSRLEFRNFLDRFQREDVVASVSGSIAERVDVQHVTTLDGVRALAETLKSTDDRVVLRFEFVDDVDPRRSPVQAVLCSPQKGLASVVYLAPSGHSELGFGEVMEELLPSLSNGSPRPLIGHNLKPTLLRLRMLGAPLHSPACDTAIGAYLLNPSRTSYHVSDLARSYLQAQLVGREEFFGKGRSRSEPKDIELDQLSQFYAPRAIAVRQLCTPLRAEIEARSMGELYQEIELPLVAILAEMEHTGIAVQPEVLDRLETEFSSRLEELTTDIYELAGEEFNINSTQQLGKVLFEKLDFPVIKKTKTGYSTAADVLETLAVDHDADIARRVMEYRELEKLQGTYIEGLRGKIDPETGRIHTTFNQTVASTGRLSSTEPNLQNIPVRTELGRRIRQVFAASEGCALVSADYSQIELRVLAHISGDERLTEAFQQGEDIHTRTACEVFGVVPEEVSRQMRDRAKAVNFGIVYGISGFGLANQIDVSRQEAEDYIQRYLDRYPGVSEWRDQVIKEAKVQGYVTTLFSRIRYLPDLKSRVWHRRQFAERTAINTPVQGSAADIIKLAMVRVSDRLREDQCASQMLLQVHDELIFDVPHEELEAVQRLVVDVMEGVGGELKFSVPLKVDVKRGPNWYDMKPVTPS